MVGDDAKRLVTRRLVTRRVGAAEATHKQKLARLELTEIQGLQQTDSCFTSLKMPFVFMPSQPLSNSCRRVGKATRVTRGKVCPCESDTQHALRCRMSRGWRICFVEVGKQGMVLDQAGLGRIQLTAHISPAWLHDAERKSLHLPLDISSLIQS